MTTIMMVEKLSLYGISKHFTVGNRKLTDRDIFGECYNKSLT